MLTVSFVVTALVIAGVVGGGITAWLWTTHCRQLVAAGGLRALAAMRWREFSRFVIEALQQQGFEASRIEPDANRGQQADLLLNRDGQTWLLSCKQGTHHRIRPAMVDELAGAVPVHAGGTRRLTQSAPSSLGSLAAWGETSTSRRRAPSSTG